MLDNAKLYHYNLSLRKWIYLFRSYLLRRLSLWLRRERFLRSLLRLQCKAGTKYLLLLSRLSELELELERLCEILLELLLGLLLLFRSSIFSADELELTEDFSSTDPSSCSSSIFKNIIVLIFGFNSVPKKRRIEEGPIFKNRLFNEVLYQTCNK